jgi:hypothetical protein
MNGFLDLLMGEIPRLRDDERGYGPNGLGLIGHVNIPDDVLAAFDCLLPQYAQHIRPKYESSNEPESPRPPTARL